ncbi:adenylate/guanylate cyclase domain-containing protein [Cerasicoccus fimbriatus]|uniref:adenylate/guanylate cyclase domain-containing protein n=1 Tax=Cerasicoccus fimbriatus TaxID=3014554 RepID=UPI0022B4AE2B|nr:adenylate/guanylate cyclase domain-containing protein [Cerasicoccus sp. TK19100]
MPDADATFSRPPLWHRFSFRLTIAILSIVAVVTLGLLMLVQARFNAAYREFVEDRFDDQIKSFEKQFNLRRGKLEQNIITASQYAVRPQAALMSGAADRAYLDFSVELESSLRSETGGMGDAFFRLFDAEGNMQIPTENNAGQVAGVSEVQVARLLETCLVMPPADADLDHYFSLGYVSFPTPDEPSLYEVLVAPVYLGGEISDHNFVGWIALGQYLGSDMLDTESETIESGIFADGHLFSQSIPDSADPDIARIIANHHGGALPEYRLDRVNYLVFTYQLESTVGMPGAWRVQLYSLAGLEALVERIRQLAVWFLGAALLFGLALSYFVSQSFASRIEKLVGVMRQIGHGEFDVNPPPGKDELGQLSTAIKSAADELAQKEKIHQVLNMVTDPAVADEMLAGKIELGGEAREVATLFCDIRGFTPLTDGMDPRDVVELVNGHMGVMSDLASEHQGVVDKYVGDEIMVLFGAPHAYGDDWVNAVRCGLAMCAVRAQLNAAGDRVINIGVGIGAGEVIAGRMGSDTRRNYTVLGDRVNLAARLCSKAGPGEVIIDEAIRNRLPPTAVVERIDSVQLKGFKDPVPVFKVISVE